MSVGWPSNISKACSPCEWFVRDALCVRIHRDSESKPLKPERFKYHIHLESFILHPFHSCFSAYSMNFWEKKHGATFLQILVLQSIISAFGHMKREYPKLEIYISEKNHFQSCLFILLGNDKIKRLNHTLHNLPANAFFWCILFIKHLTQLYNFLLLFS